MIMTTWQSILTIAIIALGTMLTRFLPFMVFRQGRAAPPFIRYLGRVLPSAVIGMLIVYCLKDVTPLSGNHGLPELLGIVVVAVLHFWRHNTLLSILGGTAVYMLLVQVVFV